MNSDRLVFRNETDVQNFLIAPLLSSLGYRCGTENEILSQFPLKYPFSQTGRKKKTDNRVGIADYLLKVGDHGCWVLEAKGPECKIGLDEIEQVLSYARHPSIYAKFSAITNGRRFILFRDTKNSNDNPDIDIEISSIEGLVEALSGTLSPASFARYCRVPQITTNIILADGLPHRVESIRGHLIYRNMILNPRISHERSLVEKFGWFMNMNRDRRQEIIDGELWRDNEGNIRVKLVYSSQYPALERLASRKRLNEIEFVSKSKFLSRSKENPNIFDVFTSVDVSVGDEIYDLSEHKSQTSNIDITIRISGIAHGYIESFRYVGTFRSVHNIMHKGIPILDVEYLGEFEIIIGAN